MRRLLPILTVALTSCAIAPVPDSQKLTPLTIPEGSFVNELQLSRVVTRIPVEEAAYNVRYGWICQPGAPMSLPAGRLPLSQEDLHRGIKHVLEPLHYKIVQSPESVFASPSVGEIQIGATVTRLQANLCFPFSGSPTLSVGNVSLAKGSVFIEVVWELFSVSQGSVVYKSTTHGTFKTDEAVTGGIGTLTLNALTASLSNLAADEQFRAIITKRPVKPAAPEQPGQST